MLIAESKLACHRALTQECKAEEQPQGDMLS